jgi:transposase-like protein
MKRCIIITGQKPEERGHFMNKRREYSAEYKVRLVLEALKEEKTLGEIASREGINPNQICNWKREFLENAGRVFAKNKLEKEAERKIQELEAKEKLYQAKVGQLTLEVDFLKECGRKIHSDGWKDVIGYRG